MSEIIDITQKQADKIRDDLMSGDSGVYDIKTSFRDGTIFLDVARMSPRGITSYRIIKSDKSDKRRAVIDKVKELYNESYMCGIRDEATFGAYADEIIEIIERDDD